MERKKYEFDRSFLIENIKMAKKLLEDKNITDTERQSLQSMISHFVKYLKDNVKDTKQKTKSEKINKKTYEKLEKKFNSDLKKLPINFWYKIIYLYNSIDLSTFEDKEHNNMLVSESEMINTILNFYEDLDKDYYEKAKEIITHPKSLINFSENSNIKTHCYFCDYLKLPFIYVSAKYDDKYTDFIHELQHGIEWLLNRNEGNILFSELGPILFEMILTDIFNSMYNSEGLYSFRINDHVTAMQWLNSYAEILIRFDKYGRKITSYNVKNIFNAANKRDFEHKINRILDIDFVDYCKYVLSFFKAIELRENYYNVDRKLVIKKLKDVIYGKDCSINYSYIVECYNRYIEEIKEKQVSYQKTVKL